MSLTSRITAPESADPSPEDIFSSSLSIIFSDDVTNQHGVAEQSINYVSPYLPKPLQLDLAKALSEEDRYLFSHYLWNASLLLAELVERDSLELANVNAEAASVGSTVNFDVRGLSIMEIGAGTALPSIMAGLVGASRVVVTDYPTSIVISTLRNNVERNIQAQLAPSQIPFNDPAVLVDGHAWGDLTATSPLCPENRHAFDRLFVCDCLWMPEQHTNLHRSISYFLRADQHARAWVIAGFHTGRRKMRTFFEAAALAAQGLEIDAIWERECDGNERPWNWNGEEEKATQKRWLVIASLRRSEAYLNDQNK